jgi:7-cyano-7-deazaguanine synthase
MPSQTVVTLLSGGIDSMVLADLLRERRELEQLFVFVDYGQRASTQEYKAAAAYAKGRGRLERISITLKGLPLGSQLVTGRLGDPAFLPGRDLLLLMVAGWKACQIESDFIGIGLRDVPQFPDTSNCFVRAFEGASFMAFGRAFTVMAPLLQMSKGEVVQLGKRYGTPLSLSYSCYLGEKRPCGRCLGCDDRKGLDL